MSAALSGGTMLKFVMSQQYSSLLELFIKYPKKKKITFPENTFSLSFYVRAKMIVHAFVIQLDQLVWYLRKIKICENLYMYKVNGELFSCDITDSGSVTIKRGRHRDLNKTLQT